LSRGAGGLDSHDVPSFDRVLLDAACTGLGTLHRRPDLLLRVVKEDPARMFALQLSMLTNAAKLVRKGGVLVYSVCSPTHAEARDVTARFEAAAPGFVREPSVPKGDAAFVADGDGVLRIGPWPVKSAQLHPESPDAYQLVRFRHA
jgi:16S rRNA (cytosine967-C5)-methyltransferase